MSWRFPIGAAVEGALRSIPMEVWQAVRPRRALALCYHLVSDDAVPHVRPLFAYKTAAQFDEDVCFLRSRFEVVGDIQLVATREDGAGGPNPAAAISVDDGLEECHSVIRPILARRGVRATFFLTTGCLDNKAMIYRHQAALCVHRLLVARGAERLDLLDAVHRALPRRARTVEELVGVILALRGDAVGLLDEITGLLGVDVPAYLRDRAPYLTRAQAQDLAKEGHVLGAHGVTHRDFQALGRSEVEAEIVASCDQVASLTGRIPVPVAVPFTLDGLDREVLRRIREAHPQVGAIYGTSGLRREPRGFLNRLVSDSPRGARRGRSNVSYLFRCARAAQVRIALGRLTRGSGR